MTALPELEPAPFLKRVLFAKRSPAAYVVDASGVTSTISTIQQLLADLSVSSTEVTLDAELTSRRRTVAEGRPNAVILPTVSEDPTFWKAMDAHRSRLVDKSISLLVLSVGAARCMQQHAPNLSSLVGTIWSQPANDSVEHRALERALERARNGKYVELYENQTSAHAENLDDTVGELIDLFGDPSEDLARRRLGFVAYALMVEVLRTIEGHWPDGYPYAVQIVSDLRNWLVSTPGTPIRLPVLKNGPSVPQALAEAVHVFAMAPGVFEASTTRQSATEIVDDCLQGHAVFPGSMGRRRLFDWWLNEVVPAAWALRFPPRYTTS